MWPLLILIVMIVGVVLYVRSSSSPSTPPPPTTSRRTVGTPSEAQMLREVEVEASRLLPQIEAEAMRMMPQIEADAAKLHAEAMYEAGLQQRAPFEPEFDPLPAGGAVGGPSWMSAEDWEGRLLAYRRQGRSDKEIAEVAAHLEKRGPKQPRTREQLIARSEEIGIVTRAVYVPKEDEARYMTRDADGLPTLRLVDAGDRLAIWSPVDGGALINPKGPGLRSLGLCSSYARGADYHASAYRAADVRKGHWIDLKREPENPHDKNAVAMCAPGSRVPFAYVQRGRAPAVAHRMDAGEDMAAVSMRGPRKGRDDDTTFVLIGSRADLAALLAG